MKRILVLDPGESTGWILSEGYKLIDAGTCSKSHREILRLMRSTKPEVIVLERFHLFPGAAKSFAWNTFYPCEVIGVVRLFCECRPDIKLVEQNPSVKKFGGNFQKDWTELKEKAITTEHTKDAYLHLKYFLKHNLAKLERGEI